MTPSNSAGSGRRNSSPPRGTHKSHASHKSHRSYRSYRYFFTSTPSLALVASVILAWSDQMASSSAVWAGEGISAISSNRATAAWISAIALAVASVRLPIIALQKFVFGQLAGAGRQQS